MKPLAQFIMRGPASAVLVAWGTGVLSLLIPLVGLLSSASVALVTLRNGIGYGARVGGLAGLGCMVVCAMLLGSPWPALAVVLILWLPVWVLAAVLRFSRSLAFTAQVAGLAGAGAMLAIHALIADPSRHWLRLMEPFQTALVKDGGLDAGAAQALFEGLAPWLTGTFAAGLMLQVLLGLFIGRWWQAQVYNPGGFGADFRAFRLHPVFGIAGVALAVAGGWWPGPGLLTDLLLVLSPLWLLQGLAVIHQLHRARGAHRGWLVGFYVLLVAFMPRTLVLVVCIGLVDIWADLRARLGRRPDSPG
ncbi:DUF2232 domain-containing protein [uncultured Thiodictyon sp.]|uniref:DUF2232 domain-containing protein n=1 Tax=uncultured Thiodictyon sp. TaxID=1846217 RepID=UPI0025CD43D0|nr:DUF2232 domain-containing protein [uncultured Thiodictyon sp.]